MPLHTASWLFTEWLPYGCRQHVETAVVLVTVGMQQPKRKLDVDVYELHEIDCHAVGT